MTNIAFDLNVLFEKPQDKNLQSKYDKYTRLISAIARAEIDCTSDPYLKRVSFLSRHWIEPQARIMVKTMARLIRAAKKTGSRFI